MEATLSILTFESGEVGGTPGVITSPRSLEACLRLGYDPKDLLPVPNEAFSKDRDGKRKLTPEEHKIKYEHFESKRKEQIRAIKEMREAIVRSANNDNNTQKLVRSCTYRAVSTRKRGHHIPHASCSCH